MFRGLHLEDHHWRKLLVQEERFFDALDDVFAGADGAEVLDHLLS